MGLLLFLFIGKKEKGKSVMSEANFRFAVQARNEPELFTLL